MAADIGFIGLGKMGEPMAKNLLKAKHRLVVYDLQRERANALEAAGADWAASPRDVAAQSSVVITMLPSPKDVEMVALGKGGLKEGMPRGSVLVDMSTTGLATTQKIAQSMSEVGVTLLDAPVSRGQDGAIKGTLSIMVGGDQEAFERVKPILEQMGTDVIFCGQTGMGAVAKLVNNLIHGTISASVSEGLVLGIKAGLDLKIMLNVLTASSADNFILRNFFQNKALRGDFEPSGTVDAVKKDLELAVNLGNDIHVPLLLGSLSHQLFGILQGRGRGHQDFTAIITLIEEAAGVKARF